MGYPPGRGSWVVLPFSYLGLIQASCRHALGSLASSVAFPHDWLPHPAAAVTAEQTLSELGFLKELSF